MSLIDKDQESPNDGTTSELDKYPSSKITEEGLAADRYKQNIGKSGIAGFIKNPYVCFTAIFASLGGVLFGCKKLILSGKYLYFSYR